MKHDIIGKCSYCKQMIKRKKKINYHIFETPIKDLNNKKISYIVHTKPTCLIPFIEKILNECELEYNRIQQMLDLFFKNK